MKDERTAAGDFGTPLIWTRAEPPKRRQSPLERDDIVRAATAVADEGGAEALTMAAVARRLGPYTPMALYRHVMSKDGLVDLMLDAATAEIPVPAEPGPDWRADLRGIATESWAMAKRHLWFAQLVPTRPLWVPICCAAPSSSCGCSWSGVPHWVRPSRMPPCSTAMSSAAHSRRPRNTPCAADWESTPRSG